MADPLQYRRSNSSDDSPLQEDVSDSEHEAIPLEDGFDEPIEPPNPLDPRNSQLSLVSGAVHSLDDRQHSPRRPGSLTQRDLLKYALDDRVGRKDLRKILYAALDRLDLQTRRADEAERRALELAQRFKIVNEARVAAQQENDRVHAELRIYKVQLDNAQREILRGSDLLKDIEAQRDSAEAAAARARSTARKLKEEQLMMKAREEGRKEGYQEGLRRGYQQARGVGPDPAQLDVPPAGLPPLSTIVGSPTGAPLEDDGRTAPLDGFSMTNFATPMPHTGAPLDSTFGVEDPGPEPYGAGVQGSRFKEVMATPSTFRSAPLGSGSQRGGPSGWPISEPDDDIRPTVVRNAPPSPQHVNYEVPPDGYIPALGPDSMISLPPPHELHRPPSAASRSDEPPSASTGLSTNDFVYPRHRASPRSVADSLPSTTISQFELVSAPMSATRGLRERSSGLSAITEVPSALEYSPGMEDQARNIIYPDDDRDTPKMIRVRSRDEDQRPADSPRYSDPEQVEQWRRSTATQSHPSSSRERLTSPHHLSRVTTPSPLAGPPILPPTSPAPSHRRSHSLQSPPTDDRPHLGSRASSGTHRRTSSSTPVSIRIEPPSGPGSNISPASFRDGMLSPSSSRQPLPSHPVAPSTPTPNFQYSRSYTDPRVAGPSQTEPPRSQSPYYSMPPSQPPVPPSPRHPPVLIPGYAPYPDNRPGSSSGSIGRPKSRAGSADYTSSMGDPTGRSRTPTGRPSSAISSDRATPVLRTEFRPAMPAVPSVLRSPSRASSRQSLQPEAARPPSRSSADQQRTLSMHAGSTPAFMNRPLSSGAAPIRRVPSASSINSETSRKSGGFQHYDASAYVDPAFLASSEDLASMQSPHTMANTVANSRGNMVYGAPPSRHRPSSPSISFSSFRS